MLKRLELVGFKSFADKTIFEFPAGITAVVGPNGSGKSNVVDAVRWVLGEQSAKSLRGGEMADVIFNGSTSRRSLGMAEVTMTFDNARRRLATEAEEVQITRRVYRSGEGEYLINQQAARLKDIKELFLGSGAGTDAYSVIEQGRVDVLLQASTRDRRLVFEEAAGISRFKAKKTETLRRLEHVDQNLARVRDIIDEVEKQLRSVKLQAAKAQRYQEYTERLRDLRVRLGLAEYHQLAQRLATETAALDQLKAGLADRAERADAWEREIARLEGELDRLEQASRAREAALAEAERQIAAEDATLTRERAASADLEADLAATQERLESLSGRVAELAGAVDHAAGELAEAEANAEVHRGQVQALDAALEAAAGRLSELERQAQADKAEHLERMRQAARLHNDAVSYQAQVDQLRRERQRLQHRTEQASENLASLDVELAELAAADEELHTRLARAKQAVLDQRHQRERLRARQEQEAGRLADLRAQRTGVAGRVEVLEGLERRHEGLGTGVREVMALIEESNRVARAARFTDPYSSEAIPVFSPEDGPLISPLTSDPWLLADPQGANAPRSEKDGPRSPLPLTSDPWSLTPVLGLVADLLTVSREHAALIDVALGERAQHFVVRDADLLAEALARRERPFSGRVGFVPLGSPSGPLPLADDVAVISRAQDLVTASRPDVASLPEQLLGRTLIVRTLDDARRLAARCPGWRFVTLAGELLDADGTLTVGAHHAESGILSRKSELRELCQQAAALDGRIADADTGLAALREQAAAVDARAGSLQEEADVLSEQAADLRSRLMQRRHEREGLNEELALGRREIGAVEADLERLEAAWRKALAQAEEADRDALSLQARVENAEREARGLERRRQECHQEATAAKVALAQAEERRGGAAARHRQLEADREERRREQLDGERHVADARRRLEESRRAIENAAAALTRCRAERDAAGRDVAELTGERDLARQERQLLADQTHAVRQEWRQLQEQAHGRELEAADLRHQRDTLVGRLREDYQVELPELYLQEVKGQREKGKGDGADKAAAAGGEAPDFGLQEAVANEEIAELRRKLARLGSVNLDSLQELAELESRAASLQTQYDDLAAAKRSLEEIIDTINADSRRLFTETFAAVRTHFQELFRKLFGGGMADVVLEDENDVLESGVEVVARPPGKELRSISLMSGGEKTLTAVALLLAVFRSKPSPFCILDEVDAALDEANIGRFTTVLREFLDQSQFIIITHSKRTMAVADVLYGVTMQESGVSKRVAVRFEDWVDPAAEKTVTPPAPAHANGNGDPTRQALGGIRDEAQ